jgi:MFS family permease
MQIPVGILLDKYSPRYLTAFAIFICGLSTYIFSESSSLTMGCMARGFIGFGAAFAAVSCFKAASLWFLPKRFALISGMYMTAAMLGAVGGQAPLSFLVSDYGWRISLKIIAAIGIILSVLYVIIVRDKKISRTTGTNQIKSSFNFWYILKNKQAWLLSIYSGLAFAPVSVFGGLWGVPFLQQAYIFSAQDSAIAVSWIFIGFAVGAPLLGWSSDKMGMRKPIMMLGTLLALLSLLIVIYSAMLPLKLVSLLLFLFGFGASGFFISFAMIREIFPLLLTATVLGFMNTFDSICEAISEPFVGVFLDMTWNGVLHDGVHHFSTLGYKLALSLLPLYLIVAFVVLLFIQETHCKSCEEVSGDVASR